MSTSTVDYTPDVVQPLNILILVISIIPSMVAILMLSRRRFVTRSALSTLVRNKFVIALLTMSVFMALANAALCLERVVNYYIDSEYNLTVVGFYHNFVQGILYNIGIGAHVWALYLRTDSALIGSNWVKVVRGLMAIFTLSGIMNPLSVFFGENSKYAVVRSSAIIFGISLLSIDVIYTICFIYFVRQTRKVLGTSKTTLTYLIATEGLRMTGLSMAALFIYIIGGSITNTTAYGWTILYISRAMAGCVSVLWARMKFKIDEMQGRERKEAANASGDSEQGGKLSLNVSVPETRSVKVSQSYPSASPMTDMDSEEIKNEKGAVETDGSATAFGTQK